MLDTFANMFRIPELRKKILFTLGILVVYRFGCLLPVPGVNVEALADIFKNLESQPLGKMLGFAAALSGGALSKSTLFCLGIMPYISATIIFQLLTGVVPALERLRKEGESGLKKIRQYERYTTVILCIFQGAIYIKFLDSMRQEGGVSIIDNHWAVRMTAIITMATGTMILMWLGDQITQFGVGNGISLIIMAGIIDRLPAGLWGLLTGSVSLGTAVFLIAAFAVIVGGVVLITQGQRRIPTQQAKHTRGRHVVGGGRQFLPFRVNHAGVMPIIFASTLLMFPAMLLFPFKDTPWGIFLNNHVFMWGTWPYILLYVILIFFFSYFWTALMFKPKDVADNLKDYGSFVPGIRPGRKTAEYLEYIMIHITLAGAAFLAIIAVIPQCMTMVGGGMEVGILASLYGGTSILIVVGVALDLVEKIESHLMMRHYEGFMRKGRIRGRH